MKREEHQINSSQEDKVLILSEETLGIKPLVC